MNAKVEFFFQLTFFFPDTVRRRVLKQETAPKTQADSDPSTFNLTTEELVEETRVFAITGVRDPCSGLSLSLSEALKAGLIDGERGDFVDGRSGRRLAIAEAIEEGLIEGHLKDEEKKKVRMFCK